MWLHSIKITWNIFKYNVGLAHNATVILFHSDRYYMVTISSYSITAKVQNAQS